jgi:tetratricopeptide (TPR) repeat protein
MDKFVERAHAAVNNNSMAEAVLWFEKAVRQNPNDVGSQAWLGQCLCTIGKRAEGIALLRQAARHYVLAARETGDIGLLLELTEELQHWSDFEGALELGEASTRINPADVRGFQLLALTYAQLNRTSEALVAGRQALDLAPSNVAMQVLQASLEADASQHAAARTRLEELLNHNLEPRSAYRAHKELARVLDRLGECDRVFPHLNRAATLSDSLPEYAEQNIAALPSIIKANRAGFDRDLLARWSTTMFPSDLPAPVFLIGFMRSGTTLTQEVLGAHADVFVSDEVDFLLATLRQLHQLNTARLSTADKLRQLGVDDILALRKFYWTKVEQRFGASVRQRTFIDKFTMNTVDIGFINCIFPDAKIIFVQRDPRDVCLSCFMQLMVPSATTVQLLNWERTARFYASVMDWWLHIRQHLTLDVVEFRYEDAVTAFEPTFKTVFEFLGLAWDPGVVDFHKHVRGKFIASPSRNQVAKPLYSSSVARWRQYASEFAPISETLQPFVQAFGYEPF